jgi:hypothetical protein
MGFDNNGFKKIQDNLEKISKQTEVKLGDLYNDNFISRHSKHSNFENLLIAGGHKVETEEELKAISDDKWSKLIKDETTFQSTEEMRNKAMEEYLKKLIAK